MNMQILIRPPLSSLDLDRLGFATEKILMTSYICGVKYDEAPQSTDCVTAVRWLLAVSSDFILPTGYIGDLPNILMKSGSEIIPLHEGKVGDLIFFERMSPSHQKYMIHHVGLMISPNEFIHSSRKYGGKISRIDDPEYMYNILSESYLPLAHDPRNSTEDPLHHRRV